MQTCSDAQVYPLARKTSSPQCGCVFVTLHMGIHYTTGFISLRLTTCSVILTSSRELFYPGYGTLALSVDRRYAHGKISSPMHRVVKYLN
jgi:hypothetical protein